MILPLLFYGNPLLRKKCKEVKEVTIKIQKLIQDMVHTMDGCKGIGLAANQVGYSLRVFIIRPVLKGLNEEIILGKEEVYINPKILFLSEEKDLLPEGCLSIPGIHCEVERSVKIRIEALNEEGLPFTTEIEGYKAREIQHEFDHLDGIFFVDRLGEGAKKEVKPFLEELLKKYS